MKENACSKIENADFMQTKQSFIPLMIENQET